MKQASSGCEPSRMEMFRACFSKDGTTKNKEAENAIVCTLITINTSPDITLFTYLHCIFEEI